MENPQFSLFQNYTKADFWNGSQELFFVELLVSYDWAAARSEMVGVSSGELMCNTHILFGNSYKWISCLGDVALNMVMSMISTNCLTSTIFVFPLVDGGNLCSVCHVHFDDRKKNATKKWRSWSQCTVCQSWSHTACGFKKSMCLYCQVQNTMQTPWSAASVLGNMLFTAFQDV